MALIDKDSDTHIPNELHLACEEVEAAAAHFVRIAKEILEPVPGKPDVTYLEESAAILKMAILLRHRVMKFQEQVEDWGWSI